MGMKFDIDTIKKNQNLIAAVLCVVIVPIIICTKFIITPRTAEMKKIRAETDEFAQKKVVKKGIDALEKEINTYKESVMVGADAPWFLRSVIDVAEDAGITPLSVTPRETDSGEGLIKLSATISLECTYEDLLRFVSNLEGTGNNFIISTLNITGIAGRVPIPGAIPPEETIEVSDEVEAEKDEEEGPILLRLNVEVSTYTFRG
ncbi:MAG: hypothetical protein HQ593_04795 [Candidatus Omnitrophica bacterium]|nr:hypothetical protein [Candidatus Omnitrophota bacterium]